MCSTYENVFSREVKQKVFMSTSTKFIFHLMPFNLCALPEKLTYQIENWWLFFDVLLLFLDLNSSIYIAYITLWYLFKNSFSFSVRFIISDTFDLLAWKCQNGIGHAYIYHKFAHILSYRDNTKQRTFFFWQKFNEFKGYEYFFIIFCWRILSL